MVKKLDILAYFVQKIQLKICTKWIDGELVKNCNKITIFWQIVLEYALLYFLQLFDE